MGITKKKSSRKKRKRKWNHTLGGGKLISVQKSRTLLFLPDLLRPQARQTNQRTWNGKLSRCWASLFHLQVLDQATLKSRQYPQNRNKPHHLSKRQPEVVLPHLRSKKGDGHLYGESRRLNTLDIQMEGWCRLNYLLCTLMSRGANFACL
jgi:hypothetical protein